MTLSAERARLLREYVDERIKDANAVAALSSEAYWLRPGFPSKERVDRWNREYLELVNRERVP